MPYQDDISKITNFAPYIETTPIRTLEMAGAQRQQQYNEGLQLIQQTNQQTKDLASQMMRPIDQEYLNTKLSTLQNSLSGAIAGDLSNQGLVNSIGGAIKSVANDDVIKNAVISKGNFISQKQVLDKHKEEGKSGVENEWDFNNQVNSYMNGKIPGETFSGKYTPYIDVNKKIVDLSKAAGVDERIVQQLFQTDKYGNPTGRINEVLAEQHFKGVDKQKLLSEFSTSLTPSDYQQLGITGKYNMQGYTPDKLKQLIDNSYTTNKQFFEKSKQDVLSELAALQNKPKLSQTEQQRLQQLNQSVSNLTENTTSLDKTYVSDLDMLSKNPDQVKASLYTNNYLNSMAKSLAHTEESTLYKINPWYEVQMKNKEFAATQDYRRQQQDNWNKQFGWEHEKFDAELSLKFGKLFKNGKAQQSGLDAPFDTNQETLGYLNETQRQISSTQDALNVDNEKLGVEWFKIINKNNPDAPKEAGAYDVWINKQINNQAKYTGDTREKVLNRYASNFILKYKDNPDFKHLNSTIQRVLTTTNDLHDLQNKDKLAEEQAIAKLKLEGVDAQTQKDIFKSIPKETSVYVGSNRPPLKLSQQDILDLATYSNGLGNSYTQDIFTSKDTKEQSNKALNRLKAKFGTPNPSGLSDLDVILSTKVPTRGLVSKDISEVVDKLNNETTSKFLRYKNEAIKNNPITQYYSDKISSVLQEKDKPDDFKSKVVNAIEAMGDKNIEPGYDKTTMINTINDPKKFGSVHIRTSTNMDGSHDFKMVVTSTDGANHVMAVNKQIAESLTGEQFNDRERMDRLTSSLLQSLTGSTNLSKVNPNYVTPDKAAITARLQADQFPHVQIPGMTILGGDYDKDDNNTAWMKIYLKNNQTGVVTPVTLGLSKNQGFPLTNLSAYPSRITSADVLNELK